MKHKIRILCLLLCLCLLLPVFGCSRDLPVVMSYGALRLEEDIYRYWQSCYRAQFAYEESDANRDRLATETDRGIMKTFVAAALFDAYGLKLDDTAKEVIEAAMAKLVESCGTREEFDELAASYGIDYEGLRLAIAYEQKASALSTYLFGERGVYALTAADLEAYYQETYARVQMIYVSYVDFRLDAAGDRIWDASAGHYLFDKKTGDAAATAEAKAAAVRASLSGIDEEAFLSLAETYGEDPAAEVYPDGYYFSSELNYRDYIPEVTGAALSLAPGEVAEVRSEYGVHFLLALPCEEGAYEKEANADFFDGFPARARQAYYERYLETELPKITVYPAVKNKWPYGEAKPNFDLYW